MKRDNSIQFYIIEESNILDLSKSNSAFEFDILTNNIYNEMFNLNDADYYGNPDNEGAIGMELRNEGGEPMYIERGQAIAQFIFMPFLLADGDSYQQGADRMGGFGSTDRG